MHGTNDVLTVGNIAIYGTALITLFIVYYLMNYPERKLDHGIKLSLKTTALKKVARIDYFSYVRLGTGALIQRIENGAHAGGNILFEFYLRQALVKIVEAA